MPNKCFFIFYKPNAFCMTLSDIFTEDAMTPIFKQYSSNRTNAFSVSMETVSIKLPLIAITTAINNAENTYPKKVRI